MRPIVTNLLTLSWRGDLRRELGVASVIRSVEVVLASCSGTTEL